MQDYGARYGRPGESSGLTVASYPGWQDWLRKRQPPLQVIWGRYDPSFQV
jgi:hypothetical protein